MQHFKDVMIDVKTLMLIKNELRSNFAKFDLLISLCYISNLKANSAHEMMPKNIK